MNYTPILIVLGIIAFIGLISYLYGYRSSTRELERFFKKYGKEDEDKKKK